MSDVFLEEAEKGFRESLERKLQETWGEYLTENQQDDILDTMAEIVGLNLVSMELRWCIEHPDLLSMGFRRPIESILQDGFNRVDAFVIADSIADFSADIFNQFKLTIGDRSDNGSANEIDDGAVTFQNWCDENDPYDSGIDEEVSDGTGVEAVRLYSPGTDSINFESEEEMESATNGSGQDFQTNAEFGDPITIEDEDMGNDCLFSSPARCDEGDEYMADDTHVDGVMADILLVQDDMGDDPVSSSPMGSAQGDEYMADDAHVGDVDSKGGSQMDDSPAAVQSMELDDDDLEYQPANDTQQAHGTASKKGKGPQQTSRVGIDHYNNNLYSVVMGENNANWPPVSYKCKLEGCGFQGAWRAKQVHFEQKHPKEWKEATGREAKRHKCPVEGCDYESSRAVYIARHIKSKHPGYKAAKGKNSKKQKE